MTEVTTHFIPTKGSSIKENVDKQFKFASYTPYKKIQKSDKISKRNANIENKSDSEPQTIDIKKAKHEIIKLGMSAFDATKKEEAKIEQAIKLGAKPPKNKYKNYKQLLEEKKKEKLKIKESCELGQLGKNKVGNSTAKGKSFDRKRKKKNSKVAILGSYGKVTEDIKE